MAFYLLAKSRSTGEMSLIAPLTYDSRQAALDSLSALSADPAFAHADSEVFVADLDVAVPILVVASARPEPVGQPVEPDSEDEPELQEPGAGVWEAPTSVESVHLEPGAGDPVEEEVITVEPIVAEALAAEPAAEALAVEELPLTPYEQSDPVLDAVLESTEPSGPSADQAETHDLGSALKRAAGALESEGIIAPESVGPASWPWDAAAAGEPDTGAAPEGAAEEPIGVPVEDHTEISLEPVPGSVPDEDPVPMAYVPDPLEEPAVDAGQSLVVGSVSVDEPGRVVV
ncbi:MAG: hypothetical protein U1E29_13115, partial [Coriobacteriia bacterium]|nr:hypothetical protein [Coriobacteriia bacterium]